MAGFIGEAMLFQGRADSAGQVWLGPLAVHSRKPVAAGSVKVAVRPEAWQLLAPDAGAMAATLLEHAYLGSHVELTLQTELGEIFAVSPDVAREWRTGQTLSLALARNGVFVLQA